MGPSALKMADVACAVRAQPLGDCLAHVLSSSPSASDALGTDTSKVKKGVFWNFPPYIDVIQTGQGTPPGSLVDKDKAQDTGCYGMGSLKFIY